MLQKTISSNNPIPRKISWKKAIIEAIVAILIIVWLHTSISKLFDFSGLIISMKQSPVFFRHPAFFSIAGPSSEVLLGILLIFKKTRVLGLIGSFLLMAFFTWYVIYMMITMPNLPCKCGGAVNFLTWPQHLAFNIFLTLIALLGIILYKKHDNNFKTNTPSK